jgi:hypothetical protein
MIRLLGVTVAGLSMLAAGAHAGDLDPPGAPAPTDLPMIELPPIDVTGEVRTLIPEPGESVTFPIVIDEAGSYLLTQNLTVDDSTDCIRIDANNVTLDLNGFSLINTEGNSTTSSGISMESQLNVTIRNGSIAGFFYGVEVETSSMVTVEDLRLQACKSRGISLGINSSTAGTVRRCQVNQTGGSLGPESPNEVYGIYFLGGQCLIEDNVVSNVLESPVQDSFGIFEVAGTGWVLRNRVINAEQGIRMNTPIEYQNNLTKDVDVDFTSGIDLGGNF